MAKKNYNLDDMLQDHHIKPTAQRLGVLSTFVRKKGAMSLSVIQQSLGKDFDRITLYRTLQLFEEKGLIHKIPDKGIPSYALCKHDTIAHVHDDNHVHFKCITCDKTYCLDEVEIPEIVLPGKYQARKLNFLIEGVCAQCA